LSSCSDLTIDFESALREAECIFREIVPPGTAFVETVPHPEDIIFENAAPDGVDGPATEAGEEPKEPENTEEGEQ